MYEQSFFFNYLLFTLFPVFLEKLCCDPNYYSGLLQAFVFAQVQSHYYNNGIVIKRR